MALPAPDLQLVEKIQRLAVRVVGQNAAGRGLVLVGGLRFRLVDGSGRMSLDLDYHCPDDLGARQVRLVALFRERLLPVVRTRLGCDGRVAAAVGPDSENPLLRTVELVLWKPGVAGSQIVMPVDLFRMPCLDRPQARTVDGAVCLVASDGDMIESKALAIVGRTFVAARDFVDFFLFSHMLEANAKDRLARKLRDAGSDCRRACVRLGELEAARAPHVRAIAATIEGQVDSAQAASLELAGGANMVFDQCIVTLRQLFGPEAGGRR